MFQDNSSPNMHSNEEELMVGMEFENLDSAYDFYCRYAHKIGFSVRKKRVTKFKGTIRGRTFCCSREGKRAYDKRRVNAAYRRPITRIGCKAEMTCKLKHNGRFEVVSFNSVHVHPFVKSPSKSRLRSKRKISLAQKAHAEGAEKIGLSNKATVDLMSRQAGGREYLGFSDTDYRNYIYTKRRTEMQKGDAGAMLEYFQKKKREDPSFYYAIQVDEDDLITNIFWADSRSIIDYQYFGDVICFDTTFRTNEYGRPFAPFVGVNNHKQTIIFGGALLYDETEKSFTWVFETFLAAMSGKHPQTILTDQPKAIGNAIEVVFKNTNHRLCVWHIYQNGAKHLNHVFQASKKFSKDFGACVYDYENEEEWLCAWQNMLQEYGLLDNQWLQDLYKEREKWAMIYGRHMFTADMKSTQRSESMNNVLKKYLNSKYNLLQFFEHYERLLDDRRYKELTAEFKMRETTPLLLADVGMLRDAVELYTPEAFKMFQNEYMKVWDCTIQKEGKYDNFTSYKVSYGGRVHSVKFDSGTNDVECSCMKFTFVGILCSHALKVLDKKNIKNLPASYVMKRWSKEGKDSVIQELGSEGFSKNPNESIGKRYANLCHDFREVTTIGAEDMHMHNYSHNVLQKLLKDLQQMKKQRSYGNLCDIPSSSNLTPVENDSQSKFVRGIKTKPTAGRPRNSRYKDPLELKKRQKPQSSKTQGSSVIKTVTKKKEKKTRASTIQEIVPNKNCASQEEYERTQNFQNYHSVDEVNPYGSGVPLQGKMSFMQLLQRSIDNSEGLVNEN